MLCSARSPMWTAGVDTRCAGASRRGTRRLADDALGGEGGRSKRTRTEQVVPHVALCPAGLLPGCAPCGVGRDVSRQEERTPRPELPCCTRPRVLFVLPPNAADDRPRGDAAMRRSILVDGRRRHACCALQDADAPLYWAGDRGLGATAAAVRTNRRVLVAIIRACLARVRDTRAQPLEERLARAVRPAAARRASSRPSAAASQAAAVSGRRGARPVGCPSLTATHCVRGTRDEPRRGEARRAQRDTAHGPWQG